MFARARGIRIFSDIIAAAAGIAVADGRRKLLIDAAPDLTQDLSEVLVGRGGRFEELLPGRHLAAFCVLLLLLFVRRRDGGPVVVVEVRAPRGWDTKEVAAGATVVGVTRTRGGEPRVAHWAEGGMVVAEPRVHGLAAGGREVVVVGGHLGGGVVQDCTGRDCIGVAGGGRGGRGVFL